MKRVQSVLLKKVREFKPTTLITMALDEGNHAHHKAIRMIVDNLSTHKEFSSFQSYLAVEEGVYLKSPVKEPRSKVWTQYTSQEKSSSGVVLAGLALQAAAAHKSQLAGHLKLSSESIYLYKGVEPLFLGQACSSSF